MAEQSVNDLAWQSSLLTIDIPGLGLNREGSNVERARALIRPTQPVNNTLRRATLAGNLWALHLQSG
jgi:hypothetical protein